MAWREVIPDVFYAEVLTRNGPSFARFLRTNSVKPPLPDLPQEVFEESIEILSLVSDESALFDLDMPDFDEIDLETDDSDPSFRLGDLNL